MNKKNPSEINDFRGILVRVVRLERTVSWSQTRRDTNFAIPGYSLFCHDTHGGGEKQRFFCLWSFMWSKPLLCHFQQPGEIQQTQASQGFAAFYHDLTRIPPRHSQSRRATNCATPRYEIRRSGWAYSPKPPALPTALHPDMKFRNSRKIKFNTFFRNAQRFSALQFWGVCGML